MAAGTATLKGYYTPTLWARIVVRRRPPQGMERRSKSVVLRLSLTQSLVCAIVRAAMEHYRRDGIASRVAFGMDHTLSGIVPLGARGMVLNRGGLVSNFGGTVQNNQGCVQNVRGKCQNFQGAVNNTEGTVFSEVRHLSCTRARCLQESGVRGRGRTGSCP